MRRTKEDAEITRQQLLKSALVIFSEKGYTTTRLTDIAEAAGVTRGAIYWHFGSKKELLLQMLKEQVDPYFEIISHVIKESLTPSRKLEKIFNIILEKLNRDKEFLAKQHYEFIELKIRGEIPEMKDFIKRRSENFSRLIHELIKSGISTGEFRNVDPNTIITVLAAIIAGYGIICLDKDSPFSINVKSIIDIMLNGLKAI